jgi:peroxiredoxin
MTGEIMQSEKSGVFFDPMLPKIKQPGEKLEPGFRCHDFFVRTITDRVLELSSFAGKRLWIAFYRYAGCPICASHLAEVFSNRELLKEADVSFLAVFDCKRDSIPSWLSKLGSPEMMVIADDNKGLYETFGVEKSWGGLFSLGTAQSRLKAAAEGRREEHVDGAFNRMPAHFLVDTNSMVAHAQYAKHLGDHLSWKTFREFVEHSKSISKVGKELSRTDVTDASYDPDFAKAEQGKFVVLYEWKIFVGKEAEFYKVWNHLQRTVKARHKNYVGARLHISSDQSFTAYSVWKSRSAWEQFWVTKEQAIDEIAILRTCIEKSFEPRFFRSVYETFDDVGGAPDTTTGDADSNDALTLVTLKGQYK